MCNEKEFCFRFFKTYGKSPENCPLGHDFKSWGNNSVILEESKFVPSCGIFKKLSEGSEENSMTNGLHKYVDWDIL